MFVASDSRLRRRPVGPVREVDSLTAQVPMPPDRLVGALLGVALIGAASAVIALIVVVVTWWH